MARALSMPEAIILMKEAFVQLSRGEAIVPVRMAMELPQDTGRVLLMPAYLAPSHRISVKLVSIMDENPARGLPLIHAMVMVLDSETGKPLALMDGEYLTALRTGAASGLATDLLAKPDAEHLAIIGTGAQARFQLQAVSCVRNISHCVAIDRSQENADRFVEQTQSDFDFPIEATTSRDALATADIICTATTANTPVFSHSDLQMGVHINAIGAYTATMCEIPPETVQAAKVVVDHRPSCLSEAGDLIQPLQQGLISESHILAELGEIAAREKEVRFSASDTTLFKSVGNAVQDLVTATRVLENSLRLGLGAEAIL